MASATIYAGPGKLLFNGVALWPEQVNGLMTYKINQQKLDFAQAMHGRAGSQLGDTVGKVSLTPFDNWSAIPALLPTYIGAGSNGNPGALFVGQRPHNPITGGGGAADIPGVIWNPLGLEITIKRLAVTRHPDIHLGVGKALFGPVELTALPRSTNGASPVSIGTSDAFHAAIVESGATDPGGTFGLGDFVRDAWTGVWGNVAGFGGDGNSLPIQAEDEWVISTNATYNEIKVQGQTIAMELASVEYMAHGRPYGPTWTQINAAVLTSRLLGSRWGFPGGPLAQQQDFTLTSASSLKHITLINCDVHEEGFEFGGTRLTTGEIGFVTQVVYAGAGGGATNPPQLITFSQ